jgi:hypothetical protein
MSKFFLIGVVVFTICITNAQNSKSYLGVSVGVAKLGGDSVGNLNNVGLNLGFINFGYRFNDSWGVTINLNSSGFLVKNNGNSAVGVGVFSVGPIYTKNLGKKISLDLKPQYALSVVGKSKGTGDDDATLTGNGFVLGSSVNFGVSKGFKISINLDYTAAKWQELQFGGQVIQINSNNRINIIALGTGLRYNF